jgi:hypothetical protein
VAVSRSRTANLKLNRINYDAVGYGVAEDENWEIIDAAITVFNKITGLVGSWKNSTLYNVGDLVVESETGLLFLNNTQHTSPATGSFSQARAATPSYWTQKSIVVTDTGGGSTSATVRPEDYGAISVEDDEDGDTTDCTSALSQAAAVAAAGGIPLQLDKTYRVRSKVNIDLDTYDVISIQGNGRILCDADLGGEPFIDIICTAEATYAISAIDNTATQDFSGGQGVSNCAKLTLTDPAHTVTAGRVLKVISDDALAADASGRVGEVVYVAYVNGADVYTAARLRNTYTTSPRAGMYKENKRVYIAGISLIGDAALNLSATRKWIGLRVQGVVGPILERVKGRDGSNAFLVTQGCVYSFYVGCDFERGLNVSGISGYGIKDNNSEYTRVIGCSGLDVRHLYTSDTTTANAANPFTFGAPFGGLIEGSVGHNCSASPFDTHPTSEGFVFSSNRSFSTYSGFNTAFGGVQLWGNRHRIEGHKHVGGGAGVLIGTNVPGTTNRHIINDLAYDGDFIGVYCRVPQTFELNNSRIVTSYTFGAVSLSGSTMYGRGNEYVLQGTITNRRVYDLQGTSTVEEDGPLYDFTQAAAAASWLIGYSGATNSLTIRGGRVKTGTNPWTAVVYSPVGTPTALTLIKYSLTTDLQPVDTNGIDSAVQAVSGAFNNIYPLIVVDGVNSYSSAYRASTPTPVSHHFVAAINNCPASKVIRAYINTDSLAYIDLFSVGLFKGQELVIINDAASSQSFSVKTTTTNVLIVADTAVAPNSALGFTWNGTAWVCISIGVTVSGGVGVTDHGALTGLADDDHSQYHNDARAATWLATQPLDVLSDVPTRGAAGTYIRVATGGTALEYAKPVDAAPSRDAATIAPSTHVADTAALVDASVSLYPIATVTKVAVRLFASTAKAIWMQLTDHAFAIVGQFNEESDGTPTFKLWNATGAAVKMYINSKFAIFGGTSTDRNTTETVGIVGDLYVSGVINGPVQPGDYLNPYLIGSVRLWDDGTGLREKRGSDPSNATDGTAL